MKTSMSIKFLVFRGGGILGFGGGELANPANRVEIGDAV